MENGKCKKELIYDDGNASNKIADLLATIELSIDKQLLY